jgi:hypothetical protein
MPGRAPRRFALLCATLALGCSERALNDDLEQMCRDHCRVGRDCGYDDDYPPETLDECVEECVPSMKKRLANCAASVETSRCWSGLTCEEADEFADAIYHYAMTLEFKASFPCRDEVLEEERVCRPN